MLQPILLAVAAATVAAPATPGAADRVEVANSVRLESCRPAAGLKPLTRDVRLDEAARRIANGRTLETATAGAGYRAKLSASIRVATTAGERGVARLLTARFCKTLTDPELRDIGTFRRGEDTWFVLARPLIPPEASANALDDRVLVLVNEARAGSRRCGHEAFRATTPLRSDVNLREAATTHARDMAAHGLPGHRGSDGSMPADRATRAGYPWKAVAENVAGGQPSAEEVVDTWLASPGHCANLMNGRYSETGIAHAVNAEAEKGVYWVQIFAAPD